MPRYNSCGVSVRLTASNLAESCTADIRKAKGDIAAKYTEEAEESLKAGRILQETTVPFPGTDDGLLVNFIGEHENMPFMMVEAGLSKAASPLDMPGKTLPGRSLSKRACVDPKATPLDDKIDTGRPSSIITSAPDSNDSARPSRASLLARLNDPVHIETVPQALALHVVISERTLAVKDSKADVKIAVYFNGVLANHKYLGVNEIQRKLKSPHQIFAGHRAEWLSEQPWVILPPGQNADGSLRGLKRSCKPRERWEQLSQAVLKEADNLGFNTHGDRPPTGEYLACLAKMQMPEQVESMQKRSGRNFGVIDVVLSIGKGDRLVGSHPYIKSPTRLADDTYTLPRADTPMDNFSNTAAAAPVTPLTEATAVVPTPELPSQQPPPRKSTQTDEPTLKIFLMGAIDAAGIRRPRNSGPRISAPSISNDNNQSDSEAGSFQGHVTSEKLAKTDLTSPARAFKNPRGSVRKAPAPNQSGLGTPSSDETISRFFSTSFPHMRSASATLSGSFLADSSTDSSSKKPKVRGFRGRYVKARSPESQALRSSTGRFIAAKNFSDTPSYMSLGSDTKTSQPSAFGQPAYLANAFAKPGPRNAPARRSSLLSQYHTSESEADQDPKGKTKLSALGPATPPPSSPALGTRATRSSSLLGAEQVTPELYPRNLRSANHFFLASQGPVTGPNNRPRTSRSATPIGAVGLGEEFYLEDPESLLHRPKPTPGIGKKLEGRPTPKPPLNPSLPVLAPRKKPSKPALSIPPVPLFHPTPIAPAPKPKPTRIRNQTPRKPAAVDAFPLNQDCVITLAKNGSWNPEETKTEDVLRQVRCERLGRCVEEEVLFGVRYFVTG